MREARVMQTTLHAPGHEGERGSALVVVLIVMSAVAAIAVGMSVMARTESTLAANDVEEKETFYLAEAATEEAINYLNGLGEPFRGSGANRDQPVELFANQARGAGHISVYLDAKDTNGGQATRFVQIQARAVHNNGRVAKAISVRVGQQNFSRYAYFSDLELQSNGTKIWFMSADNLYGPVHTNDQFHISGTPTFHQEASSTAGSLDYYSGGPPTDNPNFVKGVTLGAPRINLPSDLSLLKAKAQTTDGLYISGMTKAVITVTYNAALGVSQLIVKKDAAAAQTYSLPANGVVYVNGIAEVSGTLAGQLTIAAKNDLRIVDDMVYHTDPRTNPNSTDLLGLISEANVVMAATSANLDSGDETVMAAVMALGESFTAENYSAGSPRGKLKLYGGIIQKRRGPVGTFSGTTVVSGYEKAYNADLRLMDTPPPAYPTTGVIERIAWRELDPATDISANVF
jgi:Tfp pilus assembly protein PilX